MHKLSVSLTSPAADSCDVIDRSTETIESENQENTHDDSKTHPV